MNSFSQIFQMMKNPQQFVMQMLNNSQAMSNPMMQNAMEMYQKGDIQGLQKLTENVAKQKGTSIEETYKKLGL